MMHCTLVYIANLFNFFSGKDQLNTPLESSSNEQHFDIKINSMVVIKQQTL